MGIDPADHQRLVVRIEVRQRRPEAALVFRVDRLLQGRRVAGGGRVVGAAAGRRRPARRGAAGEVLYVDLVPGCEERDLREVAPESLERQEAPVKPQ
jgi:hypothetical protein